MWPLSLAGPLLKAPWPGAAWKETRVRMMVGSPRGAAWPTGFQKGRARWKGKGASLDWDPHHPRVRFGAISRAVTENTPQPPPPGTLCAPGKTRGHGVGSRLYSEQVQAAPQGRVARGGWVGGAPSILAGAGLL